LKKSDKKYSVVIADDHPIFRMGIKNIVEKDKNFELTAEFSDGKELVEYFKNNICDLIILDISMPNLDGIKAAEIIRKKYSKIKILILSTHDEKIYVKRIMSKKIDGYLLKTEVHDSLISAMKKVISGKKHVSEKVVSYLMDDYAEEAENKASKKDLTKREIEIIKLISEGMTSRQIARELDISQRTVETHRYRLMEKLKFTNTAELIKFAVYEDII